MIHMLENMDDGQHSFLPGYFLEWTARARDIHGTRSLSLGWQVVASK